MEAIAVKPVSVWWQDGVGSPGGRREEMWSTREWDWSSLGGGAGGVRTLELEGGG